MRRKLHEIQITTALILLILTISVVSPGQNITFTNWELYTEPVESIIARSVDSDDWNTTPPVEHRDWAGMNQVWQLNDQIYVTSQYPNPENLSVLREQGIQTIISLATEFPDKSAALANGMTWLHVPVFPGEISRETVVRMMNILRFRTGDYLIHAAEGEQLAYPYAAILAKWHDSRYVPVPNRALFLLVQIGFPLQEEAFLKFTLSDVSSIQEKMPQKIPHDLTSPTHDHTLPESMKRMEESLEILKDVSGYDWIVTDHPESKTAWSELRSISQISARWASITDQEELSSWFLETSEKADTLAASISQKKKPRFEDDFTALKKSCKTCHEQTRDNPDFIMPESLKPYLKIE